MLSIYQHRKIKRQQICTSYQELKRDQAEIHHNKLVTDFDEAFRAWHGRRPTKSEVPNGKKRITNATMILWAKVHEREITDGLDCDLSR